MNRVPSTAGETHQRYPVNFAGMFEDEDPDAYDRQRDLDIEAYGFSRFEDSDEDWTSQIFGAF